MKDPEISVIIPTLNEAKYIKYSMSGLKKQTFRYFETIVVDGGSKDGTVGMARRGATVIRFTKKKGAGPARNIGAAAARGSILVFLDADTRPFPGFLESYHRAFIDNDVVAATGPIYTLEKDSVWIRMGYAFVSVFFVRLSMIVGRPSIVGSNFAVRAEKFRKAKGFKDSFVTYEDWDLSNRLKHYGKIRYVRGARVETSSRRVKAWGLFGYAVFYLSNMMMYHVLNKSKSNYKQIR